MENDSNKKVKRMAARLMPAVAALLLSCSTIDCPVQTAVLTNYGIATADGLPATLTDTLWVWTPRADGTDTLLLNRGTGLTSFSLPISYQHPEDTLVFLIADTDGAYTLDTVWVKKDDIPHFESVDCSAHFFHRLTAVRSTHDGIDTLVINHQSVDYDQTPTHIHIVFKTRP